MVIFPSQISRNNQDWNRACALLLVLALDPRRYGVKKTAKRFYETADDYLDRPMLYADRKWVPAPYYSFSLHFNVSASVHGSIPVDDDGQLEEFKQTINTALQGPLTSAERNIWEADDQRRKCEVKGDPMAGVCAGVASIEVATAMRYYDAARSAIEAPRQFDGIQRAGLSSHEEILERLVQLGTSLMAKASREAAALG